MAPTNQKGGGAIGGVVLAAGGVLLVGWMISSSSGTSSSNVTSKTSSTVAQAGVAEKVDPVSDSTRRIRTAADRKAYAQTLEDKLLDIGINAHVRTLGPMAETLKVDYYSAGRVMGHNLGKNADLFVTLNSLKFSLLRLEGYSYIAQWYRDGRGGWVMQEHESSP